MKFIIDNRSAYPDTVALAAIKEMLMLPEWPNVQMSRPRAFRHQNTRFPVVTIARFGRGDFGPHFVVEDQPYEERKEGIQLKIKSTKNHPDAIIPMTAKEFYARNQEALFRKTLFSGSAMRSMVLEWIRSGDFTASDLRKHLDGPHTDMWRNVACFMPLLEKLENDHENI